METPNKRTEAWIDSLHEDANGLVWTTKDELRAALASPTPPPLDHGRCCECFDAPNMAAGHEHWDEQGA